MDNQQRRFMIQNGAILRRVAPDIKHGYKEKDLLRSFEESQAFINHETMRLESSYKKMKSINLLDEIFVAIDYPKAYIAKSYQIESLYSRANLIVVGTAQWQDKNGEIGRSDIVRGSINAFKYANTIAQDAPTKTIRKEIDRIHGIDLLTPESQITKITDQLSAKTDAIELSFFQVSSLSKLITRLNKILSLTVPLKENDVVKIGQAIYIILNLEQRKINELKKTNFIQTISLRRLKQFNPLRSMTVATARDIEEPKQCPNKLSFQSPTKTLPIVGMIDGGVYKRNNDFLQYVSEHFEVDSSPSNIAREHGTSVASVLMYGELPNNNQTVTPELAVESIRALPSKTDKFMLDLLDLDNILKNAIPKMAQIKIWNISIGPRGPVLDDHIGSLTAILDKLAYKFDVLFVIAVGNTGMEQGLSKRIQIPADSVNNFAITAYTKRRGKHLTADYASIGPGREGGKMKPDIIEHGGNGDNDVILTFSSTPWFLNKQLGTSFAAPLIARLLAKLLWYFPELDILALRATVTQYLALNFKSSRNIYDDAKGEISTDPQKVMEATANEFRIKYSGEMTTGTEVLIDVPIPTKLANKSLEFTWTTAVKTDVDASRPDAYTKFGIEDTFYSDADKYDFYNADTHKRKRAKINEEDKIQFLLEHGFVQSQQPVAHNKAYLTTPFESDSKDEAAKRRQLKWDTVKSQRIISRVSSLNRPFIKLHAISRDSSHNRVSYCVVLSVRAKNDMGLYQRTLNQYPQLIPLTQRVNSGRV
ncbi:S8 family peptidase [Lentilactobacillus hilgardii]|uniref:S8 family peptidase n=1 Tax=Lentilactobacillus hilgardii TaxID=1588 RepID=UPI00390C5297